MDRIWFILVGSSQEGPYALEELRDDVRITPDTLAWREGFPKWLPIREIPELESLFEEEPKVPEPVKPKIILEGEEEVVLELPAGPPFPIHWVIFAFFLIGYVLYRLYTQMQ